MGKKQHITILGLGNILMRDEGFGVHFVRRFLEKYRLPEGVDIVEGGTMAYTLLDTICSCERLIVIDVIKADDQPGSIYRFNREAMQAHMPPPTSAHEVQFVDVLFQAELLEEAPDVVFLCIVPECYDDMNLEMSPVMEDKLPAMEALLLKELSDHGIVPERIS